MSVRPVRFLHVGELRLDEPVRTGIPLDDRARHALAGAATAAWDQIVFAAQEHEVDFVLLNGNTFDAERAGSDTEQSLCAGLNELTDAGIDVLVRPGVLDPLEAWRDLRLPRVELLAASFDEPVEITDVHGETQAILLPLSAEHTYYDLRDDVARIGILTDDAHVPFDGLDLPRVIDYLAVSASSLWNSRSQAELPHRLALCGPQARHRSERRNSGCLLGEFSTSGEMHVRRLPTATVRLLDWSLSIDHRASLEELCLEIQSRQEQLAVEPHEVLRLIRWTISGVGELLAELSCDEGAALDRSWRAEFAPHDGLQILQQFCAVLPVGSALPHELTAILSSGAALPRERWSSVLAPLFGDHPQASTVREGLMERVSATECDRHARSIFHPRPRVPREERLI